MNLRTLTCWAIYDPSCRHIIAVRQHKYLIERLHRPAGSVLVKMKGHYVRRSSTTGGNHG